MFEVITYKDKNGKDEISDYVRSLNSEINTKKDSRIRYKKIMEYIYYLKTYGIASGEPMVKRIKNTELWELRPSNDRIFFAYWKENIFVLIHCFRKKSQKTPAREISMAEKKLKDFLERYGK